jgi:hypothetical protein
MVSQVQTVITFGKHAGKRLCELPDGYLRWLLQNCNNLDPWLRPQVRAELGRRGQKFVPANLVLADLEETLTARIAEDPALPHGTAALVNDHVLAAFEEVRSRHQVVDETELMLRPGRPPRRFGEVEEFP